RNLLDLEHRITGYAAGARVDSPSEVLETHTAGAMRAGANSRRETKAMAKILCVLYDDPIDGYPSSYARDDIPKIESYYDGQSAPTPEAIDFTPGELLGCVSGELGLRKFLEERGHELVVTSDKDG